MICREYSVYFNFLLGRTVWTKVIRNKTAVEYLFNGDAYQFNYQFQNRLPQPITLYPVRFLCFAK